MTGPALRRRRPRLHCSFYNDLACLCSLASCKIPTHRP
jgi:hypothetical protein